MLHHLLTPLSPTRLRLHLPRFALVLLLVAALGQPSTQGQSCCGGGAAAPEKTQPASISITASSVCPQDEGDPPTPAWNYTVEIVRQGGPLDGQVEYTFGEGMGEI